MVEDHKAGQMGVATQEVDQKVGQLGGAALEDTLERVNGIATLRGGQQSRRQNSYAEHQLLGHAVCRGAGQRRLCCTGQRVQGAGQQKRPMSLRAMRTTLPPGART